MSVPEITLGVDTAIIINLVDADNEPVDVSAATEIKLALTLPDHSAVVGVVYELEDDDDNADWPNGVVAGTILGADTDDAGVTALISEVKVVGGPNAGTYYGRVKIIAIQGLIE